MGFYRIYEPSIIDKFCCNLSLFCFLAMAFICVLFVWFDFEWLSKGLWTFAIIGFASLIFGAVKGNSC